MKSLFIAASLILATNAYADEAKVTLLADQYLATAQIAANSPVLLLSLHTSKMAELNADLLGTEVSDECKAKKQELARGFRATSTVLLVALSTRTFMRDSYRQAMKIIQDEQARPCEAERPEVIPTQPARIIINPNGIATIVR